MLDEHIEHFTTQALVQEPALSSDRINVEASAGTVTLRGEVQSFGRKLIASETAKACAGVNHVVNELTVRSRESVADLKIAKQLNNSFAKNCNMNEHSVRVDVHQGNVTLCGYVSSLSLKKQAEDLAMGIDGVREVTSLLMVNADRVLRNHELSVAVNAAIHGIVGMENEGIIVSIVDEMARISGNVDAIWKREAAEETVRQFGIIKVCNEIAVV